MGQLKHMTIRGGDEDFKVAHQVFRKVPSSAIFEVSSINCAESGDGSNHGIKFLSRTLNRKAIPQTLS